MAGITWTYAQMCLEMGHILKSTSQIFIMAGLESLVEQPQHLKESSRESILEV